MKTLILSPRKPIAALVLAHGAGAGMNHSFMQSLAEALGKEGIATLRFQFPYMERGSKRPDPAGVATQAVAEAVALARKKFPKLPLYAGGKSFGGRMTTTAASLGKLDGVQGIICFGFPLHQPKKPSLTRAEHLEKVTLPMLWIQGTRDQLADLKLVRKVVKKHSKQLKLHVVEAADHGFAVLKSSGRSGEEVLLEIAKAARKFCA